MKIIANNTTPITVVDTVGNILYQWNPFEGEITYLTEEKFKNSVIRDIQGVYISGEVEK